MWFSAVVRATLSLTCLRILMRAVKRLRYRLAAILVSVILAFLLLMLPAVAGFSPVGLETEDALAAPADSVISWSIRGFNYQSWWHDDYLSPGSAASLDQIAGTGANWVTIGPTQYMENAQSVRIAPEVEGRTSTDAALAWAIDDAHARGMKVMLKPHIDVEDDTWRGMIQPADTRAWFADYRAMMEGYARLAGAHNVEMIAIGTELWSMTVPENAPEWHAIIGSIRSLYGGKLTYAASQNEYRGITFWDRLDFLGVDIYFPLTDMARPTINELMAGWTGYNGVYGRANWVSNIEAWQSRWNKPVIFTEVGYRSATFTARSPWDYSSAGEYDGDLQARAYDAVFRVFGNRPWMAGALWWNWGVGDNGGAGDTNYTIANKPAELVVSDRYSAVANQQPSLTVEADNISWSSYADYRERLLHVNFLLSNNGGTARRVSIIAGSAGNGVVLASALPVDIGDLPQGGSSAYSATYWVPHGVSVFRALPYISFDDLAGTTHYLPVIPPGL